MSAKAFARLLRATTALSTVALATPAAAQLAAPAPVRQSVDANGVDLFAGTLNVDAPALAIGGEQGLSYRKLNRGGGWTDTMTATLNVAGPILTVSLGGSSDSFTVANGVYAPTEGNGATLVLNATTNIYTYTRSDGTVARFDRARRTAYPYYANEGRVLDIVEPSGAKLTFSYETLSYCTSSKAGSSGLVCMTRANAYRLSAVRNGYGYQLGFAYREIAYFDPDDAADQPDFATWSTVAGVGARNLAASPGAATASQSFDGDAVTDALGRVTRYRTGPGGQVLGITGPGAASEDVVVAYASGRVASVATPAGTTSYAAADANGERTVTVTDPLQHATGYVFEIASRRLVRMVDALGRTTAWAYDGSGRMTRATAPEGNYTSVVYDARGNVVESRAVAKPGSGVADLVVSATYPATCANPKTCNQPVTTTDVRGGVTRYEYEPHGGVRKVTAPAPAAGAASPEVRYGYQTLQAYFDLGSGVLASGEPVVRLQSTSTCRTLASCAGGSDETVETIGYGPQAAGTGNNLQPVSRTVAAGDGGVSATVATAYDAMGNVAAVDGPLAGAGDTVRYRWDAARQLVGIVGPDPDGAGPLKHRAERRTLDPKGRVVLVEAGTVADPSDAAWGAFASLQAAATGYDLAGRVVREELRAGSVTYALTQRSYDAAGRAECVVQRMNPAAFGPAPGACAAGTAGADGPDRITRMTYDEVGRMVAVTSAYGTADQSNDRTVTYTPNGKPQWLGDGNGNISTYTYDGHDRVARFTLPSKTNPGMGAGDTDYEAYGYAANGDVASRRLRDGRAVAYGYDALGRVVSKDVPNAPNEFDITYAYDLLGQLTRATDSNGHFSGFSYDALGRKVGEQSNWTARAFEYDAAGRRTKLTWGDGFYVTYAYDASGAMTAIRENGAAMLASFAYDDLGRRKSLTRGNGTVTTYSYDPASRLTSLGLDLGGTTRDHALTFTYNAAGQIATRTASNDAYAFAAANADRAFPVNGLNQATAAGAAAIGHDARGNVTGIGSAAFGYTSENRLALGAGRMVAYDPVGRFHWIDYTDSPALWMQYDDDWVIEERSQAGVAKRYVHGPGADEPLVWYEGAGTADKRYLHADERGSIVAVTNAAGTATAINTYDEYGQPGAGNVGRFQYTGQKWLPELGLYDYKARMYAPSLGRFMQADPIGYGDGMNLYGYVGGDPVNFVDPSGTDQDAALTLPRPRLQDDGASDVVVRGVRLPRIEINGSITIRRDGGVRFRSGADGGGSAVGARPQSGNLETRCYSRATDQLSGPPHPFEYDPQTQLARSALAFGKHAPGSGKSEFGGDITSSVALFSALQVITPGSIAVPTSDGGRPGRTVRITAATGLVTGTDAISGMQTQYLTAIYNITGRKTENGLNEAVLVTAYPGCPR